MFLLRAVLNILVRNASPRGPRYFRCLIFSLSGPCDLLFFAYFYCLLDMRSGECNVVSLYVLCCIKVNQKQYHIKVNRNSTTLK